MTTLVTFGTEHVMLTALPNESAEGASLGRTPSSCFYPADLRCLCRCSGHENPDNPFLQSIVAVLNRTVESWKGAMTTWFLPSILPRPDPD